MPRPSKYPPKNKTCPICKKVWVARTPQQIENQKLCSRECRTVSNAKKRRMKKQIRPCKQCGNPVYFLPCQEKTKWFCSKKCGAGYHNSGSGNPQWKGGDRLGRYWKRQARIRDGFTCQYPGCGKRHEGNKVHAHHKIPASIGGTYSLDNLITLCNKHHRLVENRLFKALVEAHPESARAILAAVFQEMPAPQRFPV